MTRILIGWELGGATGHIRRIIQIADALTGAGHEVILAVQRIEAVPLPDRRRFEQWQAPLWPALIGYANRPTTTLPATHADIFARMGLDRPGGLSLLLRHWDRLLGAIRPDLVVTEYAPALLRACAGRIPTLAVGTGFDLPPATMPSFPSLNGKPAITSESQLLARVNEELVEEQRQTIATLPGLFGADAALVCSFPELDCYAAWRDTGYCMPNLARPLPSLDSPRGPGIFVYWSGAIGTAGKLWQGLSASGLPVRAHLSLGSPEEAEQLRRLGIRVAPQPLPFTEIARTSRLVVSHGGMGFVSSAMLAGIPQIVVPYDLEKLVQARAVSRLGVGIWAAPPRISAERMAAHATRLIGNPQLTAQARSLAEQLHARSYRDMIDGVLASAATLLAA